jgi:hypothetical protein
MCWHTMINEITFEGFCFKGLGSFASVICFSLLFMFSFYSKVGYCPPNSVIMFSFPQNDVGLRSPATTNVTRVDWNKRTKPSFSFEHISCHDQIFNDVLWVRVGEDILNLCHQWRHFVFLLKHSMSFKGSI